MLSFLFPLVSLLVFALSLSCDRASNDINEIALECGISPQQAREGKGWITWEAESKDFELYSPITKKTEDLGDQSCLSQEQLENKVPLILRSKNNSKGTLLTKRELDVIKNSRQSLYLIELEDFLYSPLKSNCSQPLFLNNSDTKLPLAQTNNKYGYLIDWSLRNADNEQILAKSNIWNESIDSIRIKTEGLSDGKYTLDFKLDEIFTQTKNSYDFSCELIVDRTKNDLWIDTSNNRSSIDSTIQFTPKQIVKFKYDQIGAPVEIYSCFSSFTSKCSFSLVKNDSITIPESGNWILQFYSKDKAGNKSDIKSLAFISVDSENLTEVRSQLERSFSLNQQDQSTQSLVLTLNAFEKYKQTTEVRYDVIDHAIRKSVIEATQSPIAFFDDQDFKSLSFVGWSSTSQAIFQTEFQKENLLIFVDRDAKKSAYSLDPLQRDFYIREIKQCSKKRNIFILRSREYIRKILIEDEIRVLASIEFDSGDNGKIIGSTEVQSCDIVELRDSKGVLFSWLTNENILTQKPKDPLTNLNRLNSTTGQLIDYSQDERFLAFKLKNTTSITTASGSLIFQSADIEDIIFSKEMAVLITNYNKLMLIELNTGKLISQRSFPNLAQIRKSDLQIGGNFLTISRSDGSLGIYDRNLRLIKVNVATQNPYYYSSLSSDDLLYLSLGGRPKIYDLSQYIFGFHSLDNIIDFKIDSQGNPIAKSLLVAPTIDGGNEVEEKILRLSPSGVIKSTHQISSYITYDYSQRLFSLQSRNELAIGENATFASFYEGKFTGVYSENKIARAGVETNIRSITLLNKSNKHAVITEDGRLFVISDNISYPVTITPFCEDPSIYEPNFNDISYLQVTDTLYLTDNCGFLTAIKNFASLLEIVEKQEEYDYMDLTIQRRKVSPGSFVFQTSPKTGLIAISRTGGILEILNADLETIIDIELSDPKTRAASLRFSQDEKKLLFTEVGQLSWYEYELATRQLKSYIDRSGDSSAVLAGDNSDSIFYFGSGKLLRYPKNLSQLIEQSCQALKNTQKSWEIDGMTYLFGEDFCR